MNGRGDPRSGEGCSETVGNLLDKQSVIDEWGDILKHRLRPIFHVAKRLLPLISALILAILALAAITAPYYPARGDLRMPSIPPFWQEGGSMDHVLGTDPRGRDILTRMMHGARVSMTFAALTMAIGVALGALLGAMSAYFGGHVDKIIMRLVNITSALTILPVLVVVMTIVMIVFGASFRALLVILSLFTWGGYARQVRGEVLQIKEMDYVALARPRSESSGSTFCPASPPR